jgi:hypothetical protein
MQTAYSSCPPIRRLFQLSECNGSGVHLNSRGERSLHALLSPCRWQTSDWKGQTQACKRRVTEEWANPTGQMHGLGLGGSTRPRTSAIDCETGHDAGEMNVHACGIRLIIGVWQTEVVERGTGSVHDSRAAWNFPNPGRDQTATTALYQHFPPIWPVVAP